MVVNIVTDPNDTASLFCRSQSSNVKGNTQVRTLCTYHSNLIIFVLFLFLGLNSLQSGLHRQHMKDLFVELCLTVPVRLSSLLPYLPMLMDPLVSALNGSQTLVSQVTTKFNVQSAFHTFQIEIAENIQVAEQY